MLSVDGAHRLIAQHLIGDAPRAVHSAVVALLMRELAERTGADPTLWELTGLCHDLDFTAVDGDWTRHGILAAEWLRDDLPQVALDAIRAHDHRTGYDSHTPLALALRLADALAVARDHLGPALAALLAAGSPDELPAALYPRTYLATMIKSNAEAIGIAPRLLAGVIGADATMLGSVTPDAPGFAQLREESRAQGHRMLLRFEENWRNGSNRFDQPGEAVFGAYGEAALIGLCGRNRDPYDDFARAGRVRHLYVTARHRGNGVGRALLERVVDGAERWFDYLNTNCPPEAAGFYERLGFLPVTAPNATHRLTLAH